jgi:5-methylcytosine-specific restriction endonuclease McrA
VTAKQISKGPATAILAAGSPSPVHTGRTKTCTKCDASKALAEFYKHGDRLRPDCKACNRKQALARYAANPGRRRETDRVWRLANPEHAKAQKHRHRAAGRITAATYRAVFAKSDGTCCYCSVAITLKTCSIDHKFPIILGGTNARRNLQAICLPCNVRKGGKTHREFATWLRKHHCALPARHVAFIVFAGPVHSVRPSSSRSLMTSMGSSP